MSQKRKVKILNTDYNKESNLVKWHIKDIKEDKEITLAWGGSDLAKALGIKKDIPPDVMKNFCEEMIGKTINLIMEKEDLGVNSFNISDVSETELKNFDNKFNPYQDVMGKILEEESESNEGK